MYILTNLMSIHIISIFLTVDTSTQFFVTKTTHFAVIRPNVHPLLVVINLFIQFALDLNYRIWLYRDRICWPQSTTSCKDDLTWTICKVLGTKIHFNKRCRVHFPLIRVRLGLEFDLRYLQAFYSSHDDQAEQKILYSFVVPIIISSLIYPPWSALTHIFPVFFAYT